MNALNTVEQKRGMRREKRESVHVEMLEVGERQPTTSGVTQSVANLPFFHSSRRSLPPTLRIGARQIVKNKGGMKYRPRFYTPLISELHSPGR